MLPTFDAFALPILQLLAASPDGLHRRAIMQHLTEATQLTPEDLAHTNARGKPTFEDRAGWACSWLKANGWATNPRRAHWAITDQGRARLATGTPITAAEMRPSTRATDAQPADLAAPATAQDDATPEERITEALAEITAAVEALVLERLQAAPPAFFERAMLKLLASMGYAGKLGSSEHSGKTADGGIDGILYLDRLHLERVYVQAKRWRDTVGSATARDFAGAMDAEGATKGVIFTTAGFTAEARKYVDKSPKAIRLVDGPEIAKLMVEFGVGVSRAEVLVLPSVDEDFFEHA